MKDAVEGVVAAVYLVGRKVERIVRRRAAVRGIRVLDQRARLVPVVLEDVVAPNRILLALLGGKQHMRAVADRKPRAERDLEVVVVSLRVLSGLRAGPET